MRSSNDFTSQWTIQCRGAKRGLAFTRCWFRTKGEQLTGSSITSVTIHLGIHALACSSFHMQRLPSRNRTEQQYHECFAVLDGLKPQVQRTGNARQQAA
jgi:hypothetical protein